MPTADVAGLDLYYDRNGQGAPILLIQGLSGTHRSWGPEFLQALQPGFDVIAYDHRGIGLSGASEGQFSIVDLAEDAAGLLDALEIEQAHVVGVSMGGMVAQELALRHPGRVHTLTLGCTYCGGPDGRITDPAVFQRLVAAWASRDRDRVLRASFDINVSAAYAAQPGTYEAFAAAATAVPANLSVIFEQARATSSHDTSERLGALTMPTLVVHGDQDQMLAVGNGRQIAALIPGARLEVLEGVGHLFWLEQPEHSAQLIRDHARAADHAQAAQ